MAFDFIKRDFSHTGTKPNESVSDPIVEVPSSSCTYEQTTDIRVSQVTLRQVRKDELTKCWQPFSIVSKRRPGQPFDSAVYHKKNGPAIVYARKKKICSDNGIRLIEWKYTEPVSSAGLKRKCKELGITI